MKLFICWSGGRGYSLAELMKGWLALVLGPSLEPFLSSDIPKGEEWYPALKQHIDRADAVLVCLTPESRSSPWMHFEAGTIVGKVGTRRAFTYLYRMDPKTLEDPLAQIQSTVANELDTPALARALAGVMDQVGTPAGPWEQRLDAAALSKLTLGLARMPVWLVRNVVPRFDDLFQKAAFQARAGAAPRRFLDRHGEALQTWSTLDAAKERIEREASRFARGKYHDLLMAVHALADTFLDLGTRALVSGAEVEACEQARLAVEQLAGQLADEPQPPLLARSEAFALLGPEEEGWKKDHMQYYLQRLGSELQIDAELDRALLLSPWELDRIVYYKHHQADAQPLPAIENAQNEATRAEAWRRGPSYALECALWTARKALGPSGSATDAGLPAALQDLLTHLRRIRPVANDIPAAELPGHIAALEKALGPR